LPTPEREEEDESVLDISAHSSARFNIIVNPHPQYDSDEGIT